jgi:large subunit ribosomal protein L24
MLIVRKNDRVQVISGADAGKSGRVLEVFPKKNRVLVEHVHIIKRHTRPNPQKQIKGGIAEKEASIHLSNVQLICPTCNAPKRVGIQIAADGRKQRVCKKCSTVLDKA